MPKGIDEIDIAKIFEYAEKTMDMKKIGLSSDIDVGDYLFSRLNDDFDINSCKESIDEIVEYVMEEIKDVNYKKPDGSFDKDLFSDEIKSNKKFKRSIQAYITIIKNKKKIEESDCFDDYEFDEIVGKIVQIFLLKIYLDARDDIIPLLERGIYSKDIKDALTFYYENSKNEKINDERVWQNELEKRKIILDRLLSGNTVFIKSQATVGVSGIDGKGEKISDFMLKDDNTGNAILVEIKTPATKILGTEYRATYPLSSEISGTISQIMIQRNELMKNFYMKQYKTKEKFDIHFPKCVIIAGCVKEEMNSNEKKEAFEIQRNLVKSNIDIYGFDEIYKMLSKFNYVEI